MCRRHSLESPWKKDFVCPSEVSKKIVCCCIQWLFLLRDPFLQPGLPSEGWRWFGVSASSAHLSHPTEAWDYSQGCHCNDLQRGFSLVTHEETTAGTEKLTTSPSRKWEGLVQSDPLSTCWVQLTCCRWPLDFLHHWFQYYRVSVHRNCLLCKDGIDSISSPRLLK